MSEMREGVDAADLEWASVTVTARYAFLLGKVYRCEADGTVTEVDPDDPSLETEIA